MKIIKPKNENYSAIVVEIKTLVPLEKCDFVQAAIIMGNQVIVSKDVKIGDIGLYFPVECELSKEYLSNNNLYRKPELNTNVEKKGYFEESGRIRCVKFKGHKSEGLFMPINSINLLNKGSDLDIDLKTGDCFDELNGTSICKKYVVKYQYKDPLVKGPKSSKSNNKLKYLLADNQFRFHDETSMLYRNLHKINPNSLIHISYKLHGSSSIVSNVLINKRLKWYEKLLIKLGVDIPTKEYGFIYSSGKPKSNLPKGIVDKWKNDGNDYYSSDIWKLAYEKLKDFVSEGMSVYSELVGYTPTGSAIQKDYDYGQEVGTFGIYIYRVTYTNPQGKVFEFGAKQVQDWCKKNGLNAVPELYYGYAKDFNNQLITNIDLWQSTFLDKIKQLYNEKNCYICANKVPEEGCVIRIEGNDFEAFKAKSNVFYLYETKQLDKGEVNIEDVE